MAKVIDQTIGDKFAMYHADCVDVMRGIPDDYVHFSVFSPPFASLFTYSASPRDFGNVTDNTEFFEQHAHMVRELYRVIKPGRLVSAHCMLLPTSKMRDGFIGLTDFRGDLIRQFQAAGFVFHSEVVIWKDPVSAMQRTKALGLLHKQVAKDSCMSRQGIPDYLVTMRKPGENSEPVEGLFERFVGEQSHDEFVAICRVAWERKDSPIRRMTFEEFLSVNIWQRYASPVWMDIDPNDTLQFRSVREDADERHLCPLQLPVIRRALDMWSNPGDTILSPFAGIGSEGVVAVQEGRRFIGAELKASYYKQAVANLQAVANPAQTSLFG